MQTLRFHSSRLHIFSTARRLFWTDFELNYSKSNWSFIKLTNGHVTYDTDFHGTNHRRNEQNLTCRKAVWSASFITSTLYCSSPVVRCTLAVQCETWSRYDCCLSDFSRRAFAINCCWRRRTAETIASHSAFRRLSNSLQFVWNATESRAGATFLVRGFYP